VAYSKQTIVEVGKVAKGVVFGSSYKVVKM